MQKDQTHVAIMIAGKNAENSRPSIQQSQITRAFTFSLLNSGSSTSIAWDNLWSLNLATDENLLRYKRLPK